MLAQTYPFFRYAIEFLFVLAALGLARAVGIGLLRRLERGSSRPFAPRDIAAADPFFRPFGDLAEVPNRRRHLTSIDFVSAGAPHSGASGGEGSDFPSGVLAVRDRGERP